MSQTHDDPIYRTSPGRTAKMMAIMLGICIVGGAIFFAMWDYWISQPPPVVELMAGEGPATGDVTLTGVEIDIPLSFIESSDFRTLAFNALPGEPDNNPTFTANVGDVINFDVINDGRSFHSFGVTTDEEGFGGIYPDSEIATASNPLKPGESGSASWTVPEEGIFYYICTVPGHREQGMVGQIIVGNVEAPSAEATMTPEPEVMAEPEPEAMEEPEPEPEVMAEEIIEEAVEAIPVEFTGVVSLPEGSGVPGCDETNECYIPADISISVGETVTWSNDDTAAHTVTSGTPTEGPDGIFDSSIFMAGTTFEYTFDEAGEYPYFCIVHPWMTGSVSVS